MLNLADDGKEILFVAYKLHATSSIFLFRMKIISFGSIKELSVTPSGC